jgi:glycine/serine hydroxymethyltransferase
MKEEDFREFATLLAAIVSDGSVKEKDAWREQVKTFRSRFTAMHYCF